MDSKGVSLSIQTLVIIIIAIFVLVLIIFFFATTAGKQLFPSIIQKIKIALGLWNTTSMP